MLAVLERFANEFGAEIRIRDQKRQVYPNARVVDPLENVRSGEDFKEYSVKA